MKKILFICGKYPNDRIDEINQKSKNFNQDAAENYQRCIINGFKENSIALDTISVPFIGGWPIYYKDFYYKACSTEDLSFLNVWGIRNLSRYASLKRYIKKIDLNEYSNVIIYSVHTPFVKIAKYIKKHNQKTQISLFVPDLPEYINLRKNEGLIYRVAKTHDIECFYRANASIDNYILLTDFMNAVVNRANKPRVVIEGFIDNLKINELYHPYQERTKRIVYTGTLNEAFGVKTLIEAFVELNNDEYELVLCGSGDLQKYIEDISLQNERIKFMGQCNNETALEIQRNSFVLVNPRCGNEDYLKYSFPSKTMEYLASGRPVIGYNLPGIPSEYLDKLFVPLDQTKNALKDTIRKVLNLDEVELQKIHNQNINFIKNKTSKRRVLEIMSFFNDIKGE